MYLNTFGQLAAFWLAGSTKLYYIPVARLDDCNVLTNNGGPREQNAYCKNRIERYNLNPDDPGCDFKRLMRQACINAKSWSFGTGCGFRQQRLRRAPVCDGSTTMA